MFIVISPAKTLDYKSTLPTDAFTQPRLHEHTNILIERCQSLSASQIADLMHVSDKIAQLNVARFQDWQAHFALPYARQAIFAFKGDVYTGLDAQHLSQSELQFAQQHVRILSGLYGLLRPLDLMMPYRLEMGTKLKNVRGDNLYQFWQNIITTQLQQDMSDAHDQVLINLASDEYYKAINEKRLNVKVIKPVFLDQKNGRYKVISFYAKKARGLMSKFIIQHQITEIEQLKTFNLEGYYFDADNFDTDSFDTDNSHSSELIFKRDEIQTDESHH